MYETIRRIAMVDENDITIRIDGRGLSFNGAVSLRQAVEMLRIASMTPDEVATASRQVERTDNPRTNQLAELSLREALDQAAPKTSPETIAVIGAWLMDIEGVEDITRQSVRDRYQDARLSAPGNYPRDFALAVQKGFLAPTKSDKNRFYVTRTGRKLLEGAPDGS
jgi:hypothetical protein